MFILGQKNKLNAMFPRCMSKPCKQAEPETQDVGPPVMHLFKTPDLYLQNNNMFGFVPETENLPNSVSA